jgi:hypothetical protein
MVPRDVVMDESGLLGGGHESCTMQALQSRGSTIQESDYEDYPFRASCSFGFDRRRCFGVRIRRKDVLRRSGPSEELNASNW